jgi:hypothetical protein
MPSPQKASRALRTPGLESLQDLAQRIALLRSLAADHGRSEPLDITFMPSGLDMFTKAAPDAARVIDELHALEELGVTWATVTLPGETRRELLSEIQRFGAEVIDGADVG